MARFIRDDRHPSWNAQHQQVRTMLGLGPKAKLPREGMPAVFIQGIKVWVDPFTPKADGRKSSTHRVRAECPDCGKVLSAGRLHQHRCR